MKQCTVQHIDQSETYTGQNLMFVFVYLLFLSTFRVEIVKSEYLQTIVVQPKSEKVLTGDTVTLECVVFNQRGNVAWCKDGHCTMGRERPLYFIPRYEIIGNKQAGQNNLRIRNVTLDDDGIYQCQIGRTIEAHEVLSDFANLTVLIPPDQILISYVPPARVVTGKEFQMNCQVFNARPAPTFTWQTPSDIQIVNVSQRNEPMITNNKLLKSISTITLIADVKQHGKEIKCEATHVAMDKPLIATTFIAVDYQPIVKITVKPLKMIENKEYDFECIAEARPSITELVWKTNSTILERIAPVADGKYPLRITATRQMHNQLLSCSALNSAGVSEDTTPLIIHYSPEFKSFPSPYTVVRLGESLLLTCNVDSNPPANILWTKNGDYVGGGSQYQISEINEDDYAVYACMATLGGHFTKIYASTKVVPSGPPSFYNTQSVLSSIDSEVMLRCQLEKDIEPIDAFWRFHNSTLTTDMRYTVIAPRDVETMHRYETGLIIHNVEKNDFGDYECHVTNQYGTAFARVRLEQRGNRVRIQIGIYILFLLLLSVVLFSSYLCCHHACRVDRKRETIRRMRQVQHWLHSKPSMWIHNLAASEKIPLTVYDTKSGVTRTTLDPPVDIVECYVSMMEEQKRRRLNRPPPPPPPPPPTLHTMPFCSEDQSEQIYEVPDPISWHIDV